MDLDIFGLRQLGQLLAVEIRNRDLVLRPLCSWKTCYSKLLCLTSEPLFPRTKLWYSKIYKDYNPRYSINYSNLFFGIFSNTPQFFLLGRKTYDYISIHVYIYIETILKRKLEITGNDTLIYVFNSIYSMKTKMNSWNSLTVILYDIMVQNR